MSIFKKATLAILATSLISFTAACGNDTDKDANAKDGAATITISGSTSIGPLVEKEAESYKKDNGNVKVEVNQIGSSAGITNAINGVSEIGMASRDLKEEEKSAGLTETIIAYDGITVVTHPNNKVKDLTIEQVKDIFTGKYKNWKELGGDDKPIVVVSREDGSGTRDAFQELVGYESKDLIKDATIANGGGNIKTTVASNENAIGFISFEYIDDTISTVKINGVDGTPENVLNKTYSISRPFIIVHKEDKISEAGKKFIDYILSDEGQAIVAESGSIPLAK